MIDRSRTNCRLVLSIIVLLFVPTVICLWSSEPIVQTYIGQVSFNPIAHQTYEPKQVGGMLIQLSGVENEIVVSGRDKLNRPWNVYVETAAGLYISRGWMADLDGDSTQDLVLDHTNFGNGRCAGHTRLTTILFDEEGRPSPWEIGGYFPVDHSWDTDSGSGVLDLGDWNTNGTAELVKVDCHVYFQTLSVDEGYSLADVYEVHNGVWRRLGSEERASPDSTYPEVAATAQRRLAPEPPREGWFIPDYSNDPSVGTTTRITDFAPRAELCGLPNYIEVENGRINRPPEEEIARSRERCLSHFVLESGTVCYGMPSIVLYRSDRAEAVMSRSFRAQALLEQIIAEKLPVTMTGQLQKGVCSPNLIWATKP